MAKKRSSPATRFLWVIAILTILFIAAAIGYRLFERQLMRWSLVPRVPFAAAALPAGADYAQARLWLARPDIAHNPALWTPPGFAATRSPRVSVFFVHPTSFLEASAWNAPLDDRERTLGVRGGGRLGGQHLHDPF